MASGRPTLVLGGQARLPKDLSTGILLQVVVELDPDRNEVLDACCSPCVPIIERLLKQLIVGINLETEIDVVLEGIEKRLHHRSKKAVSTAVKDLLREYKEYNYQASKPEEKRMKDNF